MRVVRVEVIPICVPFEAPIISRAFTSSWGQAASIAVKAPGSGAMEYALRCIVKVHTDDGIVGIGETRGSKVVQVLLNSIAKECNGADPFAIETILETLYWTPYFAGYDGLAAIAGFEMACWDIMGKATHQPLYNLLGGLYRESIETNCYLFFRLQGEGGVGGESSSEALVEYAQQCRETFGFRVFKIKAGIASPETDIKTARLLRDKLGDEAGIIVDPNAAWPFPVAVNTCKALEEIKPLYLEDPCRGMEAMARLKRHITVPLSTNMCIVDPDSLGVGLRLDPMPVDIVLSDIHKWGGVLATKKLAAVCETFNVGVAHHSSPDVGVSEAAMLHIAASTPWINIPLDSLQHHLADDVITTRFRYENGFLQVPTGDGLGVTLDDDKVERYAERYRVVSGG